MGFSICAGTGRGNCNMDSASKANSEKNGRANNFLLLCMRFVMMSLDMEVYQKKFKFVKNSKHGFISLQLTTSLRGILDLEVLADNNINMPS